MNAILLTPEEEVIVLERMLQPYALTAGKMPVFTRTEQTIAQPAGLRITEAHITPLQPHPLHKALAQQCSRYLRLQREIRRGLVLVSLVLTAASVDAGFDHCKCLALLLASLACACVPLYMMATPAGPEVR